MTEIRTLLSLELRSLFGFNKFLYTRDRKAKNRYMGLLAAWVVVIIMLFAYVGGLVYGLCIMGLGAIVPAYLTVIASALIVLFGIFTSGNRIFDHKGYDILASMPVRPASIVISRFLGLYAGDLLFALGVFLPGVVVYGVCLRPDIGFYLNALIGVVFIPALPLVISTLLGTLVLAVSSRMKKKSMMQSVLMVLLVVGIMLGSFSMEGVMENVTLEQLMDVAKLVGDTIGKIYPPAMWLNGAIVEGNLLGLALFVLVCGGAAVLAAYLISLNFHSIMRALRNFTAKHNYKIEKLESRGMLKALYVREIKRYFSSSIYVTNTIIGPIMGAVMAVAVCVAGVDTLAATLALPVDISALLPFAFSAAFCMMTTTSVSISLEGRQFWVIKSLPIPTKTLLDSKILMNLSLMAPFYVIGQVAFVLALQPGVLELLWLLLIPALLAAFVVVFGITVNLKIHSFDWETEGTVVKQSAPAALGGFAGAIFSIILGAAVFFTPASLVDLVNAAICVALATATVLLYTANNKKRLADL